MPIYEMICECGKTKDYLSERFLSIKDTEDIICKCGKKMSRLIPNFYWKFGGRNVMSSRTDIEMDTMSMQDSMESFSK